MPVRLNGSSFPSFPGYNFKLCQLISNVRKAKMTLRAEHTTCVWVPRTVKLTFEQYQVNKVQAQS